MRRIVWSVCSCLVLSLLLPCGAYAAYITDWAAGDVFSSTDEQDLGVDGSRDILALWYRYSSGTHYFRMDLREAPAEGVGQAAPDYLILLDTGPGGASYGDGTTDPELSTLVADDGAGGLSGIDLIVDANWSFDGFYNNQDLHYYSPDGNLNFSGDTTVTGAGGAFRNTENLGLTLEWSVPYSALASLSFTMYGGAQRYAGPATYDFTEGMGVSGTNPAPEPGTLALMSVVGGMILASRVLQRARLK